MSKKENTYKKAEKCIRDGEAHKRGKVCERGTEDMRNNVRGNNLKAKGEAHERESEKGKCLRESRSKKGDRRQSREMGTWKGGQRKGKGKEGKRNKRFRGKVREEASKRDSTKGEEKHKIQSVREITSRRQRDCARGKALERGKEGEASTRESRNMQDI